MMNDERKEGRKPRGFAAMDPELLRGIAAQGGRAAHAMGKAHRFDSQEAKQAAAKRHAAKSVKAEGAPSADRAGRGADAEIADTTATAEPKS
jgi:general stress protein YciG